MRVGAAGVRGVPGRGRARGFGSTRVLYSNGLSSLYQKGRCMVIVVVMGQHLHVQFRSSSERGGRDLHVQIESGWYFGQRLQTVAFWKELDLIFLKSQRFSKSVEKWPSYRVKRLKMVLKKGFYHSWVMESGGFGSTGAPLQRAF